MTQNPLIKTLQEGDEKFSKFIKIIDMRLWGSNRAELEIKSFNHSRSLKLLEEGTKQILHTIWNTRLIDVPVGITEKEAADFNEGVFFCHRNVSSLLDEAINLYRK